MEAVVAIMRRLCSHAAPDLDDVALRLPGAAEKFNGIFARRPTNQFIIAADELDVFVGLHVTIQHENRDLCVDCLLDDTRQAGGFLRRDQEPLRGVGDDGKTPELNTVAVTHKTKRIMGIDAVVVLDRVFSNGKPVERTFDWYAQDEEGNVWYLGEDSSNYEHGRWARDEGSWEAGVGNGKPGIVMLAHPERGDAYRQEYSPGHALDQARVLGSGGAVNVPYRSFARTLATREYSAIDNQSETKYYARGVGVIKEQALPAAKEQSELVQIRR